MSSNERMTYYLYGPDGAYSGIVDLPIKDAQPTRVTIHPPAQVPAWRVGRTWIYEDPYPPKGADSESEASTSDDQPTFGF